MRNEQRGNLNGIAALTTFVRNDSKKNPRIMNKELKDFASAIQYEIYMLKGVFNSYKKLSDCKINLEYKDKKYLKYALKEYIILKTALLFEENNKTNMSLIRLPEKFKKQIKVSNLDCYNKQLNNIREENKDDIKRIRKNRNLAIAHIGINDELTFDNKTRKIFEKHTGITFAKSNANNENLHIFERDLLKMKIFTKLDLLNGILTELIT